MFKHELFRKAIHIGAIIIPLLYYFVVRNQLVAIAILLPLALLCLIIDASRVDNPKLKMKFYSLFGAHLRDEETTKLTGASYLLTSSVVAIAVFTKEIAFLSISFLAIGDTFAALIGIQFGKRKIGNSKKTLEGLIGSFVSCAGFGVLVYLLKFQKVFAGPEGATNPQPYIIMILAGALAASITEVLDLRINDNITIPMVSGIVMSIFFMII